MGQQPSKEKLLYQQVRKGNIENIRALRLEGAGLEWVDKQGNTPLMVACTKHKLMNVAKTLIELGADVNASPPNSGGSTPIRNAAMKGLDQTVELLLSRGPRGAIVKTPINGTNSALDVARRRLFGYVVRAIEGHISLFCGFLRELVYDRYDEGIDPPILQPRKIWAVVIYGSAPYVAKLELRIYRSAQDAIPRVVISLLEAELEEPNFHHTDEPSLVVVGNSSKTKHKFFSASDGDKQQLQRFFGACNGIHQGIHPRQPNSLTPVPGITPPFTSEDEDINLAMALSASLQHTGEETRPHRPDTQLLSGGSTSVSSSGWLDNTIGDSNIRPSSIFETGSSSIATTNDRKPAKNGAVSDDAGSTTSCIICFDAPREGACIPCGHMVGCVSCLNEIKANKWDCPVCRTKIEGVIKIYEV